MDHSCNLPPCPKRSHPGIWEIPLSVLHVSSRCLLQLYLSKRLEFLEALYGKFKFQCSATSDVTLSKIFGNGKVASFEIIIYAKVLDPF